MKKIILILLIILILYQPTSAEWIDKDKTLHYSAGMVIYSVADYFEADNPIRWVMIAGAGKELADFLILDGSVRMSDITATIGGGMVASYMLRYEF